MYYKRISVNQIYLWSGYINKFYRKESSLSVLHFSSSIALWNEKYTREKVQRLFKYNKTQYVILVFSIIFSSDFSCQVRFEECSSNNQRFSLVREFLYYLFVYFQQHHFFSKSMIVNLFIEKSILHNLYLRPRRLLKAWLVHGNLYQLVRVTIHPYTSFCDICFTEKLIYHFN